MPQCESFLMQCTPNHCLSTKTSDQLQSHQDTHLGLHSVNRFGLSINGTMEMLKRDGNNGDSVKELTVDATFEVNEADLPRRLWSRLNRIRTRHGCCAYWMHKWGVVVSLLCECGDPQSKDHLAFRCRIHIFEISMDELDPVSERAENWL